MKETGSTPLCTVFDDASPLNLLQRSEHVGDSDWSQAYFFAGWEQNPDFLPPLQAALDKRGVATTALSAFDTIAPLLDKPSAQEVAAQYDFELDEHLEAIPPRTLLRAARLIHITETVLRSEQPEIDVIIAQCAGSNVFLVAYYLSQLNDRPELFPPKAILLEPMLVEGRKARRVATEFARHEKSEEESIISLQTMRHADTPDLAFGGKEPLEDILDAHGITFLGLTAAQGLDITLILGEQDVAAPIEETQKQLADKGIDVPAVTFPDQERFGHGYTFAEPERTASLVASLL